MKRTAFGGPLMPDVAAREGMMGIEKGPEFAKRDIYIDYPYEEVMFRWDHERSLIFGKFYGQQESAVSVPHDNGLFNEALRFGDEISREQYLNGKGK